MSLETFRLYEHPLAHEVASGIIRRHSTNPRDVRDVALDGRDLSHVRDVLDLGCGFGYMSERVARRVAPDAAVIGVDAYEANRVPFTERVRAAGRAAHFVQERVSHRLRWPDDRFDLVVASYSLYFFPAVVPEVARVLRPTGALLAITHTEASLRAMVRLVGLPERVSALVDLVRGFSAETGGAVLTPWFGGVERVDYPNLLRFTPQDIDELLTYLQFKFKFLSDWPESEPELSALVADEIRTRILSVGHPVTLDKGDAVFWAEEPVGGRGQEHEEDPGRGVDPGSEGDRP